MFSSNHGTPWLYCAWRSEEYRRQKTNIQREKWLRISLGRESAYTRTKMQSQSAYHVDDVHLLTFLVTYQVLTILIQIF
jgi:hypothetical protein